MEVGYLGPKNSFTYKAASYYFDDSSLQPYASITNCLNALKKNQVDYAVVPIENSLEGSVHTSMDGLFQEKDITVCREIILPIQQNLLVNDLTIIPKKILSHPQALAQSQQFLETYYPDVLIEQVPSTTFAAEYVAEHPSESVAAIASKEAAREYGLEILSSGIQDNRFNQTRFWLLGKEPFNQDEYQPQKMTLFMTLPKNAPGILHKVLSAFAWREIDLSKIESRPLKTELGEYYFIIDVLIHDNIKLVEYALEEITLLGAKYQQLGYYPIVIKE
ncbi:prephenate dehydratase [Melissococcus sp. OM08-11BH]|uniref:prephenate dehydratase n=1 Tax=Melissococcus sp. OM08-11BH TaxID=2293110 RepID=UPI000E47A85F|nr:prephenate dehydratase [Melissococcus sp. OM08-11BH]RGI31991.1 prephenate dehydratase [Melissococcus sp. OM08-11BH]